MKSAGATTASNIEAPQRATAKNVTNQKTQNMKRFTKYNYSFERTKCTESEEMFKIWTQTELPYFESDSSDYSYSDIVWSDDEEVKELEAEITNLKNQNTELVSKGKEHAQMIEEHSQLKETLKDIFTENNELKNQIQTYIYDGTSKDKEINDLRNQIAQLSNTIIILERGKQQSENIKQTNNKLQSNMIIFELNNPTNELLLLQSNNKLQMKISELEEENKQIAILQQTNKELKEENKQNENMQQTINELQTIISRLEEGNKQNENMQQTINELQTKISGLEEENKQIEILQQTNKELEKENKQNENMQQTNKELITKISELQSKILQFEDDIQENESLKQTKLTELVVEKEIREKEIEAIKEENKRIFALEEQTNNYKRQIEDLQDTLVLMSAPKDDEKSLTKQINNFFAYGSTDIKILIGKSDKSTMTEPADINQENEEPTIEECEQIIDQLHRNLKEKELEWNRVQNVVVEKEEELTNTINENRTLRESIDQIQKENQELQNKIQCAENVNTLYRNFVPNEAKDTIAEEERSKLQKLIEEAKAAEERRRQEKIKRREEEARELEEKRKEKERQAQLERERMEKQLNEFEASRVVLRKQNTETRKWKVEVQTTSTQITDLSYNKLRPINNGEVDRLISVRGRSRPIAVYMRPVSSNLSVTGAFIYDTRKLPDNSLYLFVGPQCSPKLEQQGNKLLEAFIKEKPNINVFHIIRTMEGTEFNRLMKRIGGNIKQIQTAKIAGDEFFFENTFFKTALHFVNFFLGRVETPRIKIASIDELPAKGASIIDTNDIALYLYYPNLVPVDEQEKQDREAAVKWMAEQHEFVGRDVTVFNKKCIPPNLQILFDL